MAETALATAFVNVVPSTKGFGTLLNSQLSGDVANVGEAAGGRFNKGFGGVLGKIGGVFTAALAVGSVVHFTKSLIDAANEEVVGNKRLENIAKSMGLFGDQAGTVAKRLEDVATKQQLANGIDDDTIKLTQAKLLTFKDLAKSADVAGGSFDRATQAAFDLAAAGFGSAEQNATQLGKALQDPIKGLTALARSGVTFTDTEKARITQLVKSNQIGEAQNLVLKAIETQVGGTAAATATGTARMKQGWENLKETIGLSLMPAFDKFAGFMADKVFPALTSGFEKLRGVFAKLGEGTSGIKSVLDGLTGNFTAWIQGGGIQNMISGFVELRQKIFTALANALPGAITAIIDSLATALPGIVTTLLNMVPQILSTAQSVFSALIVAVGVILPQLVTKLADMLPNIVGTISAMLPGIISTAITVFLGLVQGLVTAIPKLIVALLDVLPRIIQALATMLPTIVNGAVQLFLGLVTGLTAMLPKLIDTLINVVLPKLLNTIIALIPILIPAAVTLFLALVTGLAKALPAIITAVIGLIPVIVKALIDAVPKLIDAGFQLVKGLVKGIIDNGPKLIGDAIKGMADLAVNSFKALLGIHSPSRVFIEFGKNIIQGLAKGLSGDEQSVRDSMQNVSEWVTNAFDDKKIYSKTAQAAQRLVATYTAALAPIAAAHETIVQKLNDAQDVLKTKIEERLNYIKSIAEKFGSKLNQDETTTAQSAIQQLKDRITKTKELSAVMSDLRKMGLSGDLYQQILDSGNLEFAKSILAGGSATVKELNTLADEANKTALDLGTQAGDILFNKGIEVAQGVVDGLKAKESELSALMANIASSFSNAISNVISTDTRQADTAAADAAAKKQKDAQDAYDAAVKKYGKGSKQAAGALTALNSAKAANTAAKSTLNNNLKATLAAPAATTQVAGTAAATTIIYNAAPNASIDAEQALTTAIQRARILV